MFRSNLNLFRSFNALNSIKSDAVNNNSYLQPFFVLSHNMFFHLLSELDILLTFGLQNGVVVFLNSWKAFSFFPLHLAGY